MDSHAIDTAVVPVFGPPVRARMSTFMVHGFLPVSNMRTNTLVVALVSALLIAGAGAGGALAATGPLHPQQSTTDTGNTTTAESTTTASDSATEAATADGSTGTAGASDGPSITFNDQESSGETILVDSATLPTNGFIVINGTSGGEERVIGSSYLLNGGVADNIRIELNRPLNGSESLTAVLYADSNGNGAFDADADEPVYQGDSDRRVVDIADVTVQDSSGTATSGEGDATSAATQADSGGAETTAASDGGAGTSGEANGSAGNESGGSGGSGPGFGPVVAVIALLGVAFLVRRR